MNDNAIRVIGYLIKSHVAWQDKTNLINSATEDFHYASTERQRDRAANLANGRLWHMAVFNSL